MGSDNSQPCVALLFEEWRLDSNAKFALGCVGTFFVGMLVEAIVAGRRGIKARFHGRPLTRAQGVLLRAGMIGVYAVQVTLGYMLMLIAMTYEVELFLMVVLGLTAGHGMFNLAAPVLESAEACCAGFDPDDQVDAASGRDGAASSGSEFLAEAPMSAGNGAAPLLVGGGGGGACCNGNGGMGGGGSGGYRKPPSVGWGDDEAAVEL